MESQFTLGQIRQSLERFSDYSSDLLRSDMNTFGRRLEDFLNFCSMDEVFTIIHSQLIAVEGVDFNQWKVETRKSMNKGMAGSREINLPLDIEKRISIQYQFLHALNNNEIHFTEFVTTYFAIRSNQIDAYVRALNDAVTSPLVRELKYKLRDMFKSLPSDTSATVSPSMIQIFHGVGTFIQQTASGTNIEQKAMSEDKTSQSINISGGKMDNVQIGGIAGGDLSVNQTQQIGTATAPLKPEDVTALLGELETLLRASDLAEDKKTKALTHIESAKEEAQSKEPDKDFGAKSLKKATTVLKEAGATVEAGTSLWDKVKPILETLSPWFKVAVGFFI